MEYSSLEHSIECFAVLGIAIVSSFFGVKPLEAYKSILHVFDNNKRILSSEFPGEKEIEKIILCPLCLSPLNCPPGDMKLEERKDVFQPPWRKSKREEGEAESLQLFHTLPLREDTIYHTPQLVRYGHRWCNVAMADHSVKETVDFMRIVVEAHDKSITKR